jgi:hypothetical protein
VSGGVFGLLSILFALASCGRGIAAAGRTDGVASEAIADSAPEERDPRVDDLWVRAEDGDEADLARLYDREGDTGLEERGVLPAYRLTAIQALGFAHDFTPLPWLAEVAASGSDAEAEAALDSARSLAAWPRPARDPEDALELREGCERLIALAAAKDKPKSRCDHAASVLQMLQTAGCAK